ncbi:MAG TPA: sigma-70 family RNA polymerase sigma factor, partial [Micromonosporaceae bacterium]|nr:sigma-70 family RNA polymerase sigma factor [Micromonosporaceae bacterium]
MSPLDEDFVERIRARDEAAWAELTNRYSSLLWSVARDMRLGDDDAADVVQTTWLRVVERLSSLQDPRRLGSWLATTMRRECLAVLRRQGREVPMESWND